MVYIINQSIFMKKKQKSQIINPFPNLKGNWQLINQIQSSLNKYLNNPHIYTNLQPQDQNQKLGKLNLQNIVRYIKNIVQIIENIKAEQKNIENIKFNAKIGQEKIEQHQEIMKNYEKKFNQRTKTLVDQNRMLKQTIEKLKKNQVQLEDTLKNRLQQKQNQISTYQKKQERMQIQNKRLLSVINELQDEIKNIKDKLFKLTRMNEADENIKRNDQKVIQLAQQRRKYKRKDINIQIIKQDKRASFLQRLSLVDIQAFSKFIGFLIPKQICLMMSLNKMLRLIIRKSKYCNISLYKSIIAIKNKKIGYYHQHIKYFQNMYNKIPEEILQYTYFKYHILKENVGADIMQILNKSATIFEGKFIQGEQLYSGISQEPFQQAPNFKASLSQAHILDVETSIVEQYNEEKAQQRQKLMKLFENMYNKICNTYQLYRADLQSSEMFINNILKHFSKVFVLSKNLYLQSQNLQQFNNFLLNQLNKWDKMQIDKKLKIQDLKAQLQAEKKLKLFFTDKSIKSQQKALIQQNLKLTFQIKYNKLTDSMNVVCAEKEQLLKKHQNLQKNTQVLSLQNKQNRKKYEFYLQKYNKVIEELTVVKETIVKMNI